jgi:phosphatidylinositol alpha-1,6-mannosyltransferase
VRILALITDAFGGHGGIALYNRDVLTALCRHPEVTEVVAIPRCISNSMEPLPEKLDYVTSSIDGKLSYMRALLAKIRQYRQFDMILCGHINLMPMAWLLGKVLRVPVILEIYGIDAWQPTSRRLTNKLAASADAVISISNYTRERFLSWAGVPAKSCQLLPNAIHLENYGEGEKSLQLLDRYGLKERKVILTLGRLVSQQRAKGFDEILELLPELALEIPNITYVIAGEGDYRSELEKKARVLNVQDRVVFTGMIKEEEKADLYRLADVYAMPSRGEGFGFVFLEAMACGIPVIASKIDGSRDAVRDGALGILVDPDDPEEIKRGILQGLRTPRGDIPAGLEYFAFPNFSRRLHEIVNQVVRLEQQA